MQQIEMIRKHKSQDNIDVEIKEGIITQNWHKKQEENTSDKLLVKIKDQIGPFIAKDLQEEI